jgi:protein ImuB
MFAAIVIPDFSLQSVLRLEPELRARPVALVLDDSAKSPISQVTSAARHFGVSPGITSTQAKARCEKIAFRIRSPEQEESSQEILLECAYAFAAYIESTGPGVCTLDLRGLPLLNSENIRATLEAWGAQLLQRLEEFHLTAKIGLATTPALALQATAINTQINYIENVENFWDELPIDRLCASPELIEIFRKWGISSVSAFLALGKKQIAERLGAEGLHLFESIQSETIRPLKLTTPKHHYEEYFEFENDVETLEPLLFIVRRLLDQLARRVALASLVIQDVTIALQLGSGDPHNRTLKIPAPTRDVETLFRILHNYLETVRTQSPIIALSLRAQPCPAETQQFQLFESAIRDPNRFYETIGRLNALLGPDRVGTPILHDSYKPDAFTLTPITTAPAQIALLDSTPTRRGLPARRFRPPLPTAVNLRDGQPISIRNARAHTSVARSQGPFRASGHWWENVWSREEWDIQTQQGDLYRLVRENNEWFIDAAYD